MLSVNFAIESNSLFFAYCESKADLPVVFSHGLREFFTRGLEVKVQPLQKSSGKCRDFSERLKAALKEWQLPRAGVAIVGSIKGDVFGYLRGCCGAGWHDWHRMTCWLLPCCFLLRALETHSFWYIEIKEEWGLLCFPPLCSALRPWHLLPHVTKLNQFFQCHS